MPRLSSPVLFSLILSCATVIGTPAFAADQNAYRAGTPYLKTVANHYSQCEQHCMGDAECRSWNFVRPNAGAASGICEFNSRSATPTPSSSSMSGAMNTRIDPALSRALQAGTNTIKVGTPPMIVPKMATRQPTRRVVRQPVPRQINASQANHTRPVNIQPTSRQSQSAQRVYGAVTQPLAPQTPKPAAQSGQDLTAEQAYYRAQYLAHKKQQEALQQQYQQRTQIGAPQAARPHTPQVQYIPQQQQPMPTRPLYGSLHDDLTRNMTAVPRPRTAPDNPNNADAPLSTSRAMPTRPIAAYPMQPPIVPGLVGG